VTNKTNKIYYFLGKEYVARRTSGNEGFATIRLVMVVAVAVLLPLLLLFPCAH
jgi:hypothetical protein